ncbi:hypothetical protein ZHAS_00014585 [Anopheles sinensis]|uniref:Uncharacterized protein n=1 Tax=Anopheles sinensis TaxID=74873 RepID=A0A084W8K6_ANOSI|nr:hypothetical protein ZHAS_00014585 [Anopheles sinensis]
MELRPVGQFGPRAIEKIGTISRMLPDGSAGFFRGTCRKDSMPEVSELAALAGFQGSTLMAAVPSDEPGVRRHSADGASGVQAHREEPEEEDEIDLSRFASEKDTRAYFKRKLAIFEASMMTPATANRRLAAKKLAMESSFGEQYATLGGVGMLDGSGAPVDEVDCVPPKQLLMYLVR